MYLRSQAAAGWSRRERLLRMRLENRRTSPSAPPDHNAQPCGLTRPWARLGPITELNDAAEQAHGRVNCKRVACLTRAAGISGYRRRRRVRTTVPDQANTRSPTCSSTTSRPRPQLQVRRRSSPTAWEVPALICLPRTDGTNLYLAAVINCVRLTPGRLGAARSYAHPLVIEALQHAAATRGSLIGAVLHFRPRIALHIE